MKVGDKIELIYMPNDPNPIPAGTRGTITGINNTPWDGETQISVSWENGRTLMLIHPTDSFRVIREAL